MQVSVRELKKPSFRVFSSVDRLLACIIHKSPRSGPLFAADAKEGDRSRAYGRPTGDSLGTKEQARTWQDS